MEDARRKAGLTRTQVAAQLELTERTIYRYERGVVAAKPAVIRMLADIYGVTVEELQA
jgi:transcriptional regulator with XRE-family HTH domain